MDFSGIGDSGARLDNLPFKRSSSSEVKEAMTLLTSLTGVKQFILTGICSGADFSVQIAARDPRVVGIAPIDFYAYQPLRYHLYLYRKRLLRAQSWKRLVSGQSEILGMLLSRLRSLVTLRSLKPSRSPAQDEQLSQNMQEQEALADCRSLVERGVHPPR